MNLLEYAVGFGGWIAAACILTLYRFGVLDPVVATILPVVTICCTYIVLQICQFLCTLLFWILQCMFSYEILVASVSMITLSVSIYTVLSTVNIARTIEVADIDEDESPKEKLT